jgi:type VII secretion integral membrane protein EccD
VTILTGRRMTDLVLPASAPVEEYIDDSVRVLKEILDDTPVEALDGFDFDAQGVWAFARPGAPPFKPSESLDDAQVVDGALLTLVCTTRTERYRPLVEDVIDAMAVLEESPEFDRGALHRFIALAIPFVTSAVTGAAVLNWIRNGHPWWWSVVLVIAGLATLLGSPKILTRYRNTDLAESLLVGAYPLLAGAAALAVPLPEGYRSLGAPHVAAAGVVVVALTIATRGGPRKRAHISAFVTVLAIAVTIAAVTVGYGGQYWVPSGAVALGLIVITNAAKLTVAVARIALPPIPAPGETVSHDELLDPVVDAKLAEGESPTWQAILASIPESAKRLTERSNLAKQLLIGFVAAGALLVAAGAISLLVRGHFLVHSLIVAGLVAVICGFRSRLYADRWCAWSLLAAAVVVPTGMMIRLSWWYPHHAWWILAIYVVLALSAAVLIGATDGVRRTSPVTKRILELVDGAAIAAVIPLLLWISSVYDILRNIRF